MEQQHNSNKLPRQFTPGSTFHAEMTIQQWSFLAELLPIRHIFEVDSRAKRQKKAVTKKKIEEDLNLHSFHNTESIHNSEKANSVHLKPKNIHEKSHKNTQKSNNHQPNTLNLNLKQLVQEKENKEFDHLDENMKQCSKILLELKQSKFSWPFLEPVDAINLGILQYLQIVKDPIDLSTIEKKLKNQVYKTPAPFHQDIKRIVKNSLLFNKGNIQFVKLTHDFEKDYTKLCQQFKPIIVAPPPQPKIQSNPPPTSKLLKKKKKVAPAPLKEISESQPVTTEQKQELAKNIMRLAKQHLKGVILIVFDNPKQMEETFDLQKLSEKKIKELQKYVRNKIAIMEHTIKLKQQEKNQNPDTNDIKSDEESFILDSQ